MTKLDRFRKPKSESQKAFLRSADANILSAEQVADALNLRIAVTQGRHVELENGMRGTYKTPHLLWCHKDGTGIGDNCALAVTVTGMSFRAALELLLGHTASGVSQYAVSAPARRVLHIPYTEDADRGREYLYKRGISATAVAIAEACGMLRYTSGAVLFVGYDELGKAKSATRRGYLDTDCTPKRDLSGTDKSWPAIIAGLTDEIWLVEGGVDALSAMTLQPDSYPSLVVTGGVHVTSWLDNPHVLERIKRHRLCVVAGEREKDPATQARTDMQRQQLMKRLQEHIDVELWMPPEGFKDLGQLAIHGKLS